MQYQTLKKIEWTPLLLWIVIILLGVFLFRGCDQQLVVQGYTQEDVDYKIQINELQNLIIQKDVIIAQKDSLLTNLNQHVQDFKADLDSNHTFWADADKPQTDSAFAIYFDMRM